MQAGKRLVTAEELLDFSEDYELIEGKLVQVPPANAQHGSVSNRLAFYLTAHALNPRMGEVFSQDTGFILQRNPDTVRAPDVAFVAQERLQKPLPAAFSEVMPDLVAEVASPGDRPVEVQERVQAWLRAGVRLIWVVYPVAQSVAAFYADGQTQEFAADSDLTRQPVLPGFRCRVADLFR
jgi:Uma2 family endonuclease